VTDAEARELARRLALGVDTPPDPDNASLLNPTAGGGSQSAADAEEDRLDRALVELGLVPPDALSDEPPD
jgi:hypothetical protein